ncbi:hypothetical protein [Agromyces humi]|uniref:hypothetical protein n=1 Tax=Agromyces humi TaxID=1766800 RepID=UPI0013595D13|nr:hypothetical protein [Agromyces humi]
MTSTALVFAGALLLAGCAAGGGGASSSADECDTVKSEVRDISNGAQNALAAGGDPSETQATLEGYSDRVDTLGEDTSDAVSDELEKLAEALDDAAEFAATLPSDPDAEVDADAVAEQQTAIQDAASGVNDACSAD